MKRKVYSIFLKTVCLTLFCLFASSFTAEAADDLKMGSNKVGTTWYVEAACVADTIMKNNTDYQVSVAPMAGGLGNIMLLEKYGLDIALTTNNNLAWARQGIVAFDKKPSKNIRTLVGGFDMQYVGIAVRKGSGITSLEELPEKKPKLRVMTLVKGVTGELAAAQIFEACGFSYDDIKKWGGTVEHTDFEVISNAIKDGRCDIFIQSLAKGHPTFTELAVTGKINILGVGDKAIDYMVEKYGYSRGILPAGSFKDQDTDLNLPYSTTGVSTTDRLSEEMAYNITKAIVENKEMLVAGHKAFLDYDPSMSCDPQNIGGMLLHPGAEKYYREKGMLK